jgi:hypothetical protein
MDDVHRKSLAERPGTRRTRCTALGREASASTLASMTTAGGFRHAAD